MPTPIKPPPHRDSHTPPQPTALLAPFGRSDACGLRPQVSKAQSVLQASSLARLRFDFSEVNSLTARQRHIA
ncbi:hypothetical protein [Haladaptatus litoreus]|uniref:hypothetical protein n=1 Tax=Haladaptatus litoreus TaxID=553468 RepID=UPI0011159E9B|nr:hypothetical protein [Haladaptatus litoreus]